MAAVFNRGGIFSLVVNKKNFTPSLYLIFNFIDYIVLNTITIFMDLILLSEYENGIVNVNNKEKMSS